MSDVANVVYNRTSPKEKINNGESHKTKAIIALHCNEDDLASGYQLIVRFALLLDCMY